MSEQEKMLICATCTFPIFLYLMTGLEFKIWKVVI